MNQFRTLGRGLRARVPAQVQAQATAAPRQFHASAVAARGTFFEDVEVKDGVAIVRFDGPEKMNVLAEGMGEELEALWDKGARLFVTVCTPVRDVSRGRELDPRVEYRACTHGRPSTDATATHHHHFILAHACIHVHPPVRALLADIAGNSEVKAVVVTSSKPDNFIAGADIKVGEEKNEGLSWFPHSAVFSVGISVAESPGRHPHTSATPQLYRDAVTLPQLPSRARAHPIQLFIRLPPSPNTYQYTPWCRC